MLRRLHPEQPASFAFTPANQAWADAQMTKYPEGRQASAVIPLLWRAQEQEGWVTRPAIEVVATMLGLSFIRVLEVASFYFMFQLRPVGTVAHVQICGTTSCMICGAEDLIKICREKIALHAHELSADGKFSWEEVECLGACANAPMAQIGKDYYEDLDETSFAEILDGFARGEVPAPGSRKGRFSSEPLGGATSLGGTMAVHACNASVTLATELGDTVARIMGDETKAAKPRPSKVRVERQSPAKGTENAADAGAGVRPAALKSARADGADDLKKIKGVGPKLEKQLNGLGFYHFDQIAEWTATEVAWVDQNLEGFKGRVSRDGWVEQADTLAKGGETAFSRKVTKGDVY